MLGDAVENQASSVWRDIYDGNVWASFNVAGELEHDDDMASFLTKPDNLAFMLTIDWFQPYGTLICCAWLLLSYF